ncbi:MAG: hypothetical protein A3J46_05565 [Candidatus Yanofskybacteria bacterium RIFCSPHIGHO2_02_FULL_41_11]|uniref:Fido domain-containing protein n=1 Tax=Candidatus Yanofskybacteria bacterium RIFCSPHIGHO2_02_FULL_41_11 TaxID=1802675 RepID=A0A1F8FBV1_9BACT|nr:MAG: hypothetical protein A3J46_05565 [Candidatus Yanofskybacteria bacterium RIFCSPHIGHO2_02_FULL_41_11]
MVKITSKQQKILEITIKDSPLSSSIIHEKLSATGEDASLVTIKRSLSKMVKLGILNVSGSGPSTVYSAATLGRIFAEINGETYCSLEPDKRYGLDRFNFDLLLSIPPEIFSEQELAFLDEATTEYEKRTRDISDTIRKKELERLVIELSWKSSRIEGNTYTLLDTEKLILENREAVGHDKKEAVMILNHKNAFDFVYYNQNQYLNLTRSNLENLHRILVKDMTINFGIRSGTIGVTGSKYRPLDNIHQTREAVEDLAGAISRVSSPYAKALVALLGISYIQPFEDGNKRTARLMANALLLAHDRAPLSYRSVDENKYREAMLVFYEINSIIPAKKIFIEQYDFAARNYAVK